MFVVQKNLVVQKFCGSKKKLGIEKVFMLKKFGQKFFDSKYFFFV